MIFMYNVFIVIKYHTITVKSNKEKNKIITAKTPMRLPVFAELNQCNEGEAFFDVTIVTMSPFFKIFCNEDSCPLIEKIIVLLPIFV